MTDNSNILSRYWHAYGGFSALISSWYFWISVIMSLALYPHWSEKGWWDDVLSIMPNLLGFSLGGFAMWIAIGDDNFRKLISGKGEDGSSSPYMEVNAAFVHFIILQMLALIFALFAKAYSFQLSEDNYLVEKGLFDYLRYLFVLGAYLSYFTFIYALVSAVAATLAILRVSSWYDDYQTTVKNQEDNISKH